MNTLLIMHKGHEYALRVSEEELNKIVYSKEAQKELEFKIRQKLGLVLN